MRHLNKNYATVCVQLKYLSVPVNVIHSCVSPLQTIVTNTIYITCVFSLQTIAWIHSRLRILLRGVLGLWENLGVLYFRVLLHFYRQYFWSLLRGYTRWPSPSPFCASMSYCNKQRRHELNEWRCNIKSLY